MASATHCPLSLSRQEQPRRTALGQSQSPRTASKKAGAPPRTKGSPAWSPPPRRAAPPAPWLMSHRTHTHARPVRRAQVGPVCSVCVSPTSIGHCCGTQALTFSSGDEAAALRSTAETIMLAGPSRQLRSSVWGQWRGVVGAGLTGVRGGPAVGRASSRCSPRPAAPPPPPAAARPAAAGWAQECPRQPGRCAGSSRRGGRPCGGGSVVCGIRAGCCCRRTRPARWCECEGGRGGCAGAGC
eukprot:COSAG01_NODE_1900_length_8964_cov_121.219177_6_plen_241_part_00